MIRADTLHSASQSQHCRLHRDRALCFHQSQKTLLGTSTKPQLGWWHVAGTGQEPGQEERSAPCLLAGAQHPDFPSSFKNLHLHAQQRPHSGHF